MMRRSPVAAAAIAALATILACPACGRHGVSAGTPAAESIFMVPPSPADLAGPRFFDHPWPSDYRVDARGAVLLSGIYNPFGEQILEQYKSAMAGVLRGFSTIAFGYLRFTV